MLMAINEISNLVNLICNYSYVASIAMTLNFAVFFHGVYLSGIGTQVLRV
jgi:hypothetical protein